jgi:predicted enzyme related to lactoylglutathione lyase
MFQGLRTVIYSVPDVEAAKAWYTKVFGVAPYFDEPFHVGFEIGGYELGLHPYGDRKDVRVGDNVVTYWGVPDIDVAWRHMLDHGATAREPVQEVGEGIKVGSVADPYGNVIGLIENPHFKAK